MAMQKFDVDTGAKLFIAKAGVTAVNVKTDLYSDAKEHWLSGGVAMGFPFPIRVVAGDPTSTGFVEPFFFLGQGWKIRPDEADHTLVLVGNMELDEGETGDMVVPTIGDYTVLVRNALSNKALVLNGVSDVNAIAAGVWNRDEALLTVLGSIGKRVKEALDDTISSRAMTGDPMALTTEERENIANVLLDLADSVEQGFNVRGTLRVISAMLCGLASGGPANSVFRDMANKKNRVRSVADKNGNRTVMELDPS